MFFAAQRDERNLRRGADACGIADGARADVHVEGAAAAVGVQS